MRTAKNFIDIGIAERFDIEEILTWKRRCRPRLLIVTEDGLSFRENDSFGLWRFLHAITVDAGVTNKPILTLAHRQTNDGQNTVTINTDNYSVQTGFNFSSASPAVNRSNYDQIWMFGISSSGSISNTEIEAITEFMNQGGGVFATGDHAALGRRMCGKLPRIRHMREWENIPMGTENDANTASMRIDTVTNPGPDNIYNFNDQSDNIPQRLYPLYKVSNTSATQWQAQIHPILNRAGESLTRDEQSNANAQFTNDIDVYPDHPHESVCYDVNDNATLSGNYTEVNYNFEEFPPSVNNPSQRVGAEIIAFGVSGGRSVFNNVWKPPVKPQMFGILSTYDGRLAQAYSGENQRPGRIVTDSTWHHYVNINLHGTGSIQGLGNWSGGSVGNGTFTPSADLEKIYEAYRNMITWLQPANRIWCYLWWHLTAVRYHPLIMEELLEIPNFEQWRDYVALGNEAKNLLAKGIGKSGVEDLIIGSLLDNASMQNIFDFMQDSEIQKSEFNLDELIDGMLGHILVDIVESLPTDDRSCQAKVLQEGPEKQVKGLQKTMHKAMQTGIREQAIRMEHSLNLVKQRLKKPTAK